MAETTTNNPPVDFRTEPARYTHWRLAFDGPVATLTMDVREDGGLRPGYELKLNSYDLGVDIELYDALQRLRFEHPEVGAVLLTSGKERVFCAGANIRMLGQSSHGFKVNFCKFTNETRNAMEEASAESRQVWLTAVNGPCAGGGYELALATEWIVMADDGNTAVSLPEVPLLAVLPGTGGLTRLVDKRKVRRDRADFFCTTEEGVKGKRAVEWSLVDEVVPRSRLAETVTQRARQLAAKTDRPRDARGVTLRLLRRTIADDHQQQNGLVGYDHVTARVDRRRGLAEITILGPVAAPPANPAGGGRPVLFARRTPPRPAAPARHGAADRGQLRRLPDDQRALAAGRPLPQGARPRRRSQGPRGRRPRRRHRGRGRARHVHARRHRLGGRGAAGAGGARRVLARRAHRHRGLPSLRRSGDAGDQDLRPPLRVAELDLPAAERGRPEGRAPGVRHRRAERLRPQESGMGSIGYLERIPNNVDLAGNRRLQRALEEWQPRFLEWSRDMGPEGAQARDVYLRTAINK